MRSDDFPDTWTPGEVSSESPCEELPPRYLVGVEDDTTAGFGVTHGPFKELREALDIFPDIPNLSKARVVLACGSNKDYVLYRWDVEGDYWKKMSDPDVLSERSEGRFNTLNRKQEGLKALGSGTSGFGEETKDYNPRLLETFKNKHPEKSYWVQLICGEFTSLCPRTGQADWAELVISYVPDELCVESKALKLYLASFRNHGDFHEDVCNVVADDLFKLMSPRYLEVYGRFNPRGGIAIYPYVTRCHEDDPAWVKFTEQRNLQFLPMPQRGPVLR